MHAGFEADLVGNILLQALIQTDQKINGALAVAGDFLEIGGEARRCCALQQIRHQLNAFRIGVGKRVMLGVRFEKEVEGIEHRHLRDQIDFNPKLARLVGEHQARQIIRLRVLLPVEEMRLRGHAH